MKPILLIAVVPPALVAGGLYLTGGGSSSAGLGDLSLTPQVGGADLAGLEVGDAVLGELLADVEALRSRVEELEMELALVRAASEREPVEIRPAAAEGLTAAVSAVDRARIERVVEDMRAREAEQRRVQREMEQLLERAGRLAEQVGVDAAGEKKIADLLITQQTRYRELRDGLEGVDREARRDYFRQSAQDLQAWRVEQLNTHFDANVAEQLARLLGRADRRAAERGDARNRGGGTRDGNRGGGRRGGD